jgi:hypothetical protein
MLKRVLPLLITVFLVALLWVMPWQDTSAQQSIEGPQSAASARVSTVTLYGPTRITTGTTNTSSPVSSVGGVDASRLAEYGAVDVFVFSTFGTVPVATALTVTAQYSPDATNWTDAEVRYVTWTSTGTVTYNARDYWRVLNAASPSALIQLPAAGEYIRLRMEAKGIVTPTVKLTYRQ